MGAEERGLMQKNKEMYKAPYAVEAIERKWFDEDAVLGRLFNDQDLIDHFAKVEGFSKKVNSLGYALKKRLEWHFDTVQVLKSAHFTTWYDAVLILVLNGQNVVYIHFHTLEYHSRFKFQHKGYKAVHEMELPFDLLGYTVVDVDLNGGSHFYLVCDDRRYLDSVDDLSKDILRSFNAGELETLNDSLFERFKRDISVYLPDFEPIELGGMYQPRVNLGQMIQTFSVAGGVDGSEFVSDCFQWG